MPLRNHFKPPLVPNFTWEGFHAVWPTAILIELRRILPPGFLPEPRVRLGREYEINIGTSEAFGAIHDVDLGGVATATQSKANTSTVLAMPQRKQYQYEVKIFDFERSRRLVAAIEIVSPGNQDRPDTRAAFVEKCEHLIARNISVSLVDIVVNKRFNLHQEILSDLGDGETAFRDSVPNMYATTIRSFPDGMQSKLRTWAHPLEIGQPLPTIPIWLSEESLVELNLETTYEQACQFLGID